MATRTRETQTVVGINPTAQEALLLDIASSLEEAVDLLGKILEAIQEN